MSIVTGASALPIVIAYGSVLDAAVVFFAVRVGISQIRPAIRPRTTTARTPMVMPLRIFFSRASLALISLSSSRCVALVDALERPVTGVSPEAVPGAVVGVVVLLVKVLGFFFLL